MCTQPLRIFESGCVSYELCPPAGVERVIQSRVFIYVERIKHWCCKWHHDMNRIFFLTGNEMKRKVILP